ncbi:MAG: TraB/GumN family protein [Halobacteriales archaeon]
MPGGAGAGSVTVVGTAHVSRHSVEEVREAIARHEPDVVAVELDEGRYRQLVGETPEDLDPADLLKGGTVAQLLAYWMLSYIQARLGDRFDVKPGADMRAAIEEAEARSLPVALVDRDIQVTIQRFWARMRLWEKLRLVGSLILGVAGLGRSGSVDLEVFDDDGSLTDIDLVTALLEEFRRFSPGGAEALIDERDAYIAHQLLALQRQGHDVVAVVGKGHEAGIERHLADPAGLPDVASITGSPRRRFSVARAVAYLISLVIVGFVFLLVMAGVENTFLLKLFVAWFLFNGVFAFALAKAAGAKWTSAGVGGGVAWLTSINPLLAPGWFAGYVELRSRPVNVADIKTLNELLADETKPIRELLGELVEVPLFRLIAVVAMTNVGSMIATFLFPFVVLPWLAPEVGGVGGLSSLLFQGAENSLEMVLEWLS